jgi:RNA polymerase sigma-70 factor (sigma-E family)
MGPLANSDRSREGDRADFDAFFLATFPRAVAVVQRLTGDKGAAEDAVLEAMAKANARWKGLGTESWREAWVLRVALNEALSGRRVKDWLNAAQPSATVDHADDVVLRQTLRAALQALPRRQREVVVLRHLVGLPETEVASALGISQGSVKTHLRRGLSRLRKGVGDDIKEGQIVWLV